MRPIHAQDGAQCGKTPRAWVQSFDAAINNDDLVTDHPMYFALQDVRPAAITKNLKNAQPMYMTLQPMQTRQRLTKIMIDVE